jgi:hypothetical protein
MTIRQTCRPFHMAHRTWEPRGLYLDGSNSSKAIGHWHLASNIEHAVFFEIADRRQVKPLLLLG